MFSQENNHQWGIICIISIIGAVYSYTFKDQMSFDVYLIVQVLFPVILATFLRYFMSNLMAEVIKLIDEHKCPKLELRKLS